MNDSHLLNNALAPLEGDELGIKPAANDRQPAIAKQSLVIINDNNQ